MNVLIDYAYRKADLESLGIQNLACLVMRAEKLPDNAEVSISFVTDDTIAVLNENYRSIAEPTDVLSFECDGSDDTDRFPPGIFPDEDGIYELGDIVIAPDFASRQCALWENTFEDEIYLLVVHGLLHLCGYDHMQDDEAARMEARESELLAKWAGATHESDCGEGVE